MKPKLATAALVAALSVPAPATAAGADEPRAHPFPEALKVLVPFASKPLGSACDSPEMRTAEAVVYAMVDRGLKHLDTREAKNAAMAMNILAEYEEILGCPGMARVLYLDVIETFVDPDYVAYRQRAEIGLAELRAKAAAD